jgi:hypothetical protein
MPYTTGDLTYWGWILVLGAVVIVAVVVLLSLLISFCRRIDREVVKVRDTLEAITHNTADTKLIPQTADGVDLVLAEGLQHHLFLGRVYPSIQTPAGGQ